MPWIVDEGLMKIPDCAVFRMERRVSVTLLREIEMPYVSVLDLPSIAKSASTCP